MYKCSSRKIVRTAAFLLFSSGLCNLKQLWHVKVCSSGLALACAPARPFWASHGTGHWALVLLKAPKVGGLSRADGATLLLAQWLAQKRQPIALLIPCCIIVHGLDHILSQPLGLPALGLIKDMSNATFNFIGLRLLGLTMRSRTTLQRELRPHILEWNPTASQLQIQEH